MGARFLRNGPFGGSGGGRWRFLCCESSVSSVVSFCQLCPSNCGIFIFRCGRFSLWVCTSKWEGGCWRGDFEAHEASAGEAVVVAAAGTFCAVYHVCQSCQLCPSNCVACFGIFIFLGGVCALGLHVYRSCSLCPSNNGVGCWRYFLFSLRIKVVNILLWAFHVSILCQLCPSNRFACCVLLCSLRQIFALGLHEKEGRLVYAGGHSCARLRRLLVPTRQPPFACL